uniref:MSP domain-containing protein n=1 Tax=Panagrellus redivivus TaxID=6233 RepID=A0A7E4ZQR2_PANRE
MLKHQIFTPVTTAIIKLAPDPIPFSLSIRKDGNKAHYACQSTFPPPETRFQNNVNQFHRKSDPISNPTLQGRQAIT